MLSEARREAIVDQLREQGFVEVAALCRQLGVSQVTIWRDLYVLEARGELRRVHGGALDEGRPTSAKASADTHASTDAALVAERAMQMVHDGNTVGLGSGPWTRALAARLFRRSGLLAVTNSIDIAAVLLEAGTECFFTGGSLDSSGSATGPLTVHAISGLYLDIAFLSVTAHHPTAGITVGSMEEAEVQRTMARSAKIVVGLAGRAAFSNIDLASVLPIHDVDTVLSPDAVFAAP